MKTISLTVNKSLDSLGRIVAVVRRAKVDVKSLTITANTHTYKVICKVEGEPDEVAWLISKLDKLPEVLKIEEININQ